MDSKRGLGEHQKEMSTNARASILRVLIDKQEHRYKEIKEKAKTTNPTLTKYLEQLKPLIDKRIDIESGKYPYPVYYKLKPIYALALARSLTIDLTWKEIEKQFLKTKNLWRAMEQINAANTGFLLAVFSALKQNKSLREDSEVTSLFLETFVWENYENLTLKLVEATAKVIDDIDFMQLAKNIKKA